MSYLELFLVAVGLSMDAFAVAICKGLSMQKCTLKKAGIVGLYFGIFQGGMPLLGYILGVQFKDIVESVDHWIAFVLLGIIGLNMVREAFSKEDCGCNEGGCNEGEAALDFRSMVVLAIATSIDALAVGVGFAFLKVDIVPAVSFIGVTTLIISIAGVKIGNVFGAKYKSKAEFAGGLILIFMGVKILLEGLNIL